MRGVTGLLIGLLFLTGCGFQSIPRSANQVEAAVAEVTNQYKRRADLIPNLVSTVKGYASHEKETFEAVINARANATRVSIDPSNSTPQQIQEFQRAQGGLSQALGRLMVVAERYPELKADRNFRELQAQLEAAAHASQMLDFALADRPQVFAEGSAHRVGAGQLGQRGRRREIEADSPARGVGQPGDRIDRNNQ